MRIALPPRGVPRLVPIFCLAVLAGLLLAIAYHAFLGYCGVPFPRNTFLFDPNDRFNDWHNSVAAAESNNPYAPKGAAISAYFPVAYIFFLLGAGFSKPQSAGCFLFIAIGLLTWSIWLAWRLMPVRDGGDSRNAIQLLMLLFSCLLTYPIIFALDRGNLDICIAALCIIYVATLRSRHALLGVIALAFAISLKAYPIAFLALSVADRQYRNVFLCMFLAISSTLLTLAVMWDGFSENLHGLFAGLESYYKIYVLGLGSMFASSDPYNAIRLLLFSGLQRYGQFVYGVQQPLDTVQLSTMVLKVYTPLSFAFAMTCIAFVIFVQAERWRRVTALGLVVLIFPNVANDYKLTLLLPGIIMLLMRPESSKRARHAFALMCLLMVPKSYIFIQGRGLTILMTPLLLLGLAYWVLWDRRAWRHAFRLLRYRMLWHAAALGKVTVRLLSFGRPTTFLDRQHRCMLLD